MTVEDRVRHSVTIYGQPLLFCDQSMREKASLAQQQAWSKGDASAASCMQGRQPSKPEWQAPSKQVPRAHAHPLMPVKVTTTVRSKHRRMKHATNNKHTLA